MPKRVLIIFVVAFGLMVAGAGIYAFATESGDDSAVGPADGDAVLVQQDVDPDGDDEVFGGPHGRVLDEVLDELEEAGTIDAALADEIRAAYEAKLDEKLDEWGDAHPKFGFGPGRFHDKDHMFDLDALPKWLEGIELDEDLLDLFEDGITPDEMEELKGLLPEGFKPGRGFGGFPFGSLDELGIDIEQFLEDGRIDAEERELIHEMLEERFGEGFDFRGFGRSGDDAEASFGIRLSI